MCIKLQTDECLITQAKKYLFFYSETTVCNQYLGNSITLAYTLAISFIGALRLVNILSYNISIFFLFYCADLYIIISDFRNFLLNSTHISPSYHIYEKFKSKDAQNRPF